MDTLQRKYVTAQPGAVVARGVPPACPDNTSLKHKRECPHEARVRRLECRERANRWQRTVARQPSIRSGARRPQPSPRARGAGYFRFTVNQLPRTSGAARHAGTALAS